MVDRGQIVADKYLPLLKVVDQYVHESEVNKLIARAVNEEIELIAKYINEEAYGTKINMAEQIMDGEYCR